MHAVLDNRHTIRASSDLVSSLIEVCGTPGYLAPEIIECSMDPHHQGYGTAVDL